MLLLHARERVIPPQMALCFNFDNPAEINSFFKQMAFCLWRTCLFRADWWGCCSVANSVALRSNACVVTVDVAVHIFASGCVWCFLVLTDALRVNGSRLLRDTAPAALS